MAVGLGPEERGKGLAVGYGLMTQIDIKTWDLELSEGHTSEGLQILDHKSTNIRSTNISWIKKFNSSLKHVGAHISHFIIYILLKITM